MIKRAFLLVILCLVTTDVARAQFFDSNSETILTFPIEGVSLSMTPEEARAAAKAAGYEQSGWTGIDEANPKGWTYSTPHADLDLLRHEGVLVSISLLRFAGPEPIDFRAEIERMRDHFAASKDEQWCWVKDRGGICSVQAPNDRSFLIIMRAAADVLEVRAQRP